MYTMADVTRSPTGTATVVGNFCFWSEFWVRFPVRPPTCFIFLENFHIGIEIDIFKVCVFRVIIKAFPP